MATSKDLKIKLLEQCADDIENQIQHGDISPFDQYRADDLREQARIERIKRDEVCGGFWEN